jgi:ABC-type transporter Mla MlaB component
VRDPLAMESLVVGLWRKMRAWEGVTREIERWGYSRKRTRIDMSEIRRIDQSQWPVFVAFCRLSLDKSIALHRC